MWENIKIKDILPINEKCSKQNNNMYFGFVNKKEHEV